jgi:hypothetical protein
LRGKDGNVYISRIAGCGSYVKEGLLKFPVVSREYLVYYLKELEFRYNFKANLDEMLYNALGGIKSAITKIFYLLKIFKMEGQIYSLLQINFKGVLNASS